MKTILFYSVSALSHYYSTFKVAKILQQRNCEVVYLGNEMFRYPVEKSGFKFEPLNEWAEQSSSNILKKGIPNFLRDCIHYRHNDFGYKKFKLNIDKLHEKVLKIKPDLIFIDTLRAPFFIVFQGLATKIVLISILPFSGKAVFIPPFYSSLIPKKNLFFKNYIGLLWFKNKIIKNISLHLKNAITLGQNTSSYIARFSKEIKFDSKKNFDYNRSYYYSVKNLPELILIPKSFEFPHSDLPNVYYAGLKINRERVKEVNISNARYLAVIKLIGKFKIKNSNTKLIYCSLGTLSSYDLEVAGLFFQKIAKLCNNFKDYIFIISSGDSYNPTKLLPIPQNMFVFPYVPQTDLLLHADIMITHGGINSILECIESCIPMLVYPLSLKWDQPGNSARVVYHGLGLKGNMRKDSANAMAKKLSKLFSNYQYYKNNLLKLHDEFEKENNPEKVIDILETLINNTK
jgi:zeaxanthin glucosyltransferase